MASPPPRANCFDASALVKVYVEEPGSDVVRNYFHSRSPMRYTTPFCYYETLTALKVKHLYQKQITQSQYTKAAFALTAWFSSSTKYIRDLDFTNSQVFGEVRSVAERNALDLSDAFQVLSVKKGYFSSLANDSQTVLVTADENLAKAARNEGVKAWYILGESEP